MIRNNTFLCLVGAALAVSCRVGPDYERPEVPAPEEFRGASEFPAPQAPDDEEDPVTFGDLQWFEVFDDPVLLDLITQALAANYDVRLAAERVLEARSFITIAQADLYPEVNGGGSYQRFGTSANGALAFPGSEGSTLSQWDLFGSMSWEFDFWGRFARATEAARAELLGSELARRTVIQTLVCDLTLAYFDLLELDAELEITHRTLASRERSLELVSLRLDQGVASKVEFRQAEGLVMQTAGLVPSFEQRIEIQENYVQRLLGANPGPVPRGRTLLEQNRIIDVPVGLPSDLLTRRPDVMAAEQALIAANARIGEAKALLYPSIGLTATGGVASKDLSDLFASGSGTWGIAPTVNLPIFNAGRLRSNVDITETRQRQAAMQYLQSLQYAFGEVADSLVAHEKTEEVRVWRERHEATLRDQVALSNDRYRGGVTSYLEVLDSERGHFETQLNLVQAIRDELFSSVFLYRALGGGWQGTEGLAARGPQEGANGLDLPSTGGQ